jgi:hypothetical protein
LFPARIVSTSPTDGTADGVRRDGTGTRGGRKRRAARRARGPQLTERDIEILRWITRHGVVTAELVGRRFFWRDEQETCGRWAAYRRLAALRELGLVLSDAPFAREPAVLRVTREGARIADVGLYPAPLVLSQLRHSLAVVALAEFLLAQHGGAELVTEGCARSATAIAATARTRHADGRPMPSCEFPRRRTASRTLTRL